MDTSTTLLARAGAAVVCSTDRASDYYGLGVRLGVYFAWFQSYLANTVIESEMLGALDTNTIFLLTILIAMAKDGMTGDLKQVDCLVLMHLCSGTLFGVLSLWGYRTRVYSVHGPRAINLFGSYGTHIRLIVAFTVSAFGAWFWIYGVIRGLDPMTPDDDVEPANPPACGATYTFLFARVDARGPVRHYYVVVCVLCAAYYGAMLGASTVGGWFAVSRLAGSLHRRFSAEANLSVISRPLYTPAFYENELSIIHKVLRVGNAAWLVFSMLLVEMTLNMNNIRGVLGGPDNDLSAPGQLLPFLVGAFGFARSCYAILQEKVLDKQAKAVAALEALNLNAEGLRTFTTPGDVAGAETKYVPGEDTAGDRYQRVAQRHGEEEPVEGEGGDEEHPRPKERSWALRYLTAWLPWLSLLQDYDRQLSKQGLSRHSTGLTSPFTSPAGRQESFGAFFSAERRRA